MDLTAILGTEPVVDAEEEAFVVFSQDVPSRSLGIIDAHASALEVSVAGYDLVIHQSPGLLTSNRKQGTTGAAVWLVTPLLAAFLNSPTSFLNTSSIINSSATVLELGAGVSGILALTLAPRIHHYIATDQSYVLKLLRQNIAENLGTVFPASNKKKGGKGRDSQSAGIENGQGRIDVTTLDWETDDVSSHSPLDLIVACDCIYNEALIEPLNSTCAALCKLREEGEKPTLCLIAQQLRSPDVFETWLKSFMKKFEVWQVPYEMLGEGLGEGSGFVVHVGIVRR